MFCKIYLENLVRNPSVRIYLIEDFKEGSLRASLTFGHKLQKGLLRLGHDVFPFSYRDMQRQYSFFHYCSFIKSIGKRNALRIMVSQIKNYKPDVVIFRSAVRKLDEEFIVQARLAAPHAILACWSISISAAVHPNILACARHADVFLTTSAGRNLKQYRAAGIRKCAYMPYPCDPDLEHRYEVDGKWKSDLLFTGQVERKVVGQDPMRAELIKRLVRERGLKIWGGLGKPKIRGLDYLHAISGARIGISINEFNDVPLCHSNRFINYLACGTMVLARYVPDSELLFTDGKHLRYFSTIEECLELADYYLSHEHERQAIAKAGMEHAHANFNCTAIAKDAVELITTGAYDKPWAEVL